MNENFVITKICRIIYIDKNEFTSKVSEFSSVIPHNELIFHFSGRSTLYFGNRVVELKKNILRFLPKGEYSQYRVERIENGECIDVIFDTDVPVATELFYMDMGENQKVRELFQKIFSVWVARNDGYYFECVSLLYRIFAELQKKNYLSEKLSEQIAPAVQYISEHFLEEKITAEILTKQCGISYSYIKRLFSEKYHITPKKYIIRMKMNYACDLLSSGRYSVSEVAESAGFSDIYFFSKQFKLYQGITPTEYLQKYKSSR